jgi:GNAT superfamily N-acetyltransferase
MARALHDAPVWCWTCPDPLRRLEQQVAMWRFFIAAALDYGWVWQANECATATLWIPPGMPDLRPEDEARFDPFIEELLGPEAAERVRLLFARFEAAHPKQPHFYLSLLATHPDHAHRGIGKALLADNLARIDAVGAPAFLETTNPDNLDRYERFGFALHGEFELPDGLPSVTQMWRDPQT